MGSIPIIRSNIQKSTLIRVFFVYEKVVYGNRTGGQTAQENSKNIAVVVDAIVWHHTAPACRKAVALVRGIPIIRSNIQKSTLKRVFFVLICGKSFNAFELIL